MTAIAISAANDISADDERTRVRRGWLYGLVAVVIWGGYLAVTRHGVAAGLSAADLSFLRYVTSGLLLAPWLLRHGPLQLAGLGWRKGMTLAFLAGPPFVVAGASGFLFAPLAHSAVIQLGTLTLVTIVLAALLVGERAGRRRLAGMAVIIAGLAVMAGPGLLQGGSNAWIGDLLFAAAGAMWALFTVLQRRWSVAPLAATAVVAVLSAIFYVPGYLVTVGIEPLLKVSPWILLEQALVMGVLAGVIALFAYGRAVQNLGAARAALIPVLAPAVAVITGIPLTGEIPTVLQIAGLIVLSVGLVIAARNTGSARRSR